MTTFSGLVILVGYMAFDSFTSNWQNALYREYGVSSVQMMCGVNLFSCLFTAVSLLQQGGFTTSAHFMMKVTDVNARGSFPSPEIKFVCFFFFKKHTVDAVCQLYVTLWLQET